MAEQTQQQKEQEALANTLGQAPQDGEFAAGADVPAVLANNPVLRQRLEENIAIQTGGDPNAVYQANQGGSFTQPGFQSPTVVTAAPTEQRVTDEMRQVDAAQEFLASPEAQLPGVDMGQFQLSQPQTITQPNGLTTEQEQLFSKQQELSQNRYASVEESIRQSVEQTVREVATKQRQAKGATNVQLARMGALNVSSAGIQYVNDLTNTHNQQISDIRMQGEALIQEARNARDAADLQTLSLKVQAIQDNKRLIMEEQTNYLNNIQQMQEIVKFQRDSASASINAMVEAGLTEDEIPSGYLENLDRAAGYVSGTSKGLLEMNTRARAIDDIRLDTEMRASEIALANDLNKLLVSLPVGESVTIGGIDYTSLNKGETQVFAEDNGTDTNIITFNKDTGETSVTTLTGISSGDGWEFVERNGVMLHVNPRTQEEKFLFDNNQPNGGVANPTALKSVFPDGWKPTNADLAELGTSQLAPAIGGIQCGQYVRLITGYTGGSISSLSQKLDLIDSSIGTDENPPQAGDAFIQRGGSYGHIGMVLGANKLADGSYELQITDANAKMDGTVRYRTINSRSVEGYARMGLREEFQFGTDVGSMASRFLQPESEPPKVEKVNGQDVYWDSSLGRYVPADTLIADGGKPTDFSNDQKEQFTKLDATKALESGRKLRTALINYYNYLEENGKAITSAKQKRQLDRLYSEALGALKTSETLGTLDAGLIEYAKLRLPNPDDLRGVKSIFKNENSRKRVLQESIGSIDEYAKTYYNDIISQYPEYETYDYLNKLMSDYGYQPN